MVGASNLLERVVHSVGHSSPNNKERKKMHQISLWVEALYLE